MTKTTLSKLFFLIAVTLVTNAYANSVSFDQDIYFPEGQAAQIVVTINFDFSDYDIYAGGMDLFYNSELLQFVSYTRANLDGTGAQDAASPIGTLAYEGSYVGFGLGSFGVFRAFMALAVWAYLYLILLGDSSSGVGPAECDGYALCLVPNLINPMVDLAGQDVTSDVFGEGTQAEVQYETPIPGTVWLLASGMGILSLFGRKLNNSCD